MRYSETLIPTLRDDPAEAEVISHKLMLRAGLIRKLSSGVYSYLPLALRVLRNIEKIVREEMAKAGAQEVLLPALQPAELWQETGRWQQYGKELIRLRDRHDRDFCLGPTHEEVITDLIRREVRSYRQLPINLYQIQTKFRDEVRPRFGVMRGREFVMKDAYSFDADLEGAKKNYQRMYDAYTAIFTRLGLTFRAVEADTGLIGGSSSHEFMVLAQTGEEAIVTCPACSYAANIERAIDFTATSGSRGLGVAVPPAPVGRGKSTDVCGVTEHNVFGGFAPPVGGGLGVAAATGVAVPLAPVEKVETPHKKSVEEVSAFLKVSPKQLIKTLIYLADDKPVAVLVRGDHQVNEIKLRKLLNASLLALAAPLEIEKITGAPCGFSGPIGLSGVEMIADYAISEITDGVVGANSADSHYIHVHVSRDIRVDHYADVRNVMAGDPCPKCQTPVFIDRGIEVGHVFLLGSKYSRAMGATYLNERGEEKDLEMGCYGIGISRIIAAAIEQNHDDKGMIWPQAIAPFFFHLLPVQDQSESVMKTAETLYAALCTKGDVLFDDRSERPGVKFHDADLLGAPYQIVIGEKNIAKGSIELKERRTGRTTPIPIDQAVDRLALMFAA